MSYRSVMVAVDLGLSAADRVQLAAELAERFGAVLIGVAGRQRDFFTVDPEGCRENSARLEEHSIATDLEKVEHIFRDRAGQARSEWRAGVDVPVSFVARQARCADLVVLGQNGIYDDPGRAFRIDPGEAALTIGRPALIVPASTRYVSGRRIVVAWKDTREARRAVLEALPLLMAAHAVSVLSVGDPGDIESAKDVAAYLQKHDAKATAVMRQGNDADAAALIISEAENFDADLVVMGAYGHSRAREWIFGGVTRDLLRNVPFCYLVAH